MHEAGSLKLDRVALADIALPTDMAAAVHRQVGTLTGAVPVEKIALALDIYEVRQELLDGLEGVLLADQRRNYGIILVNKRWGSRRARFSVAHELGHFLLEHHRFESERGFACDRADMFERGKDTLHQRQEREANSFAIELLAPAYLMKRYLRQDADLGAPLQARQHLEISFEAATCRYVDLHDEPLAVVMTERAVVRYVVRNGQSPWINLKRGDRISPLTVAHKAVSAGQPGITRLTESHASAWLRESGRRDL